MFPAHADRQYVGLSSPKSFQTYLKIRGKRPQTQPRFFIGYEPRKA